MSGGMFTMPFVVLNLGGEMIFILEQRLRAQSIEKDKCQKVLVEILKFMLSNSFLGELFKPQEMHTLSATRALFDKLAHASVMKLNTTSMNKLFDLMLMGVKHQVLSTTSPEEIYQITMTHLDEIMKIISGTSAEVLVTSTVQLVNKLCATLAPYDFILIKQQLLTFFQDKHIKVSLFIQENFQSLDGTLNIDYTGVGPMHSKKPGTVTYFDKNGSKSGGKLIPLLPGEGWKENTATDRLKSRTKDDIG